MQHPIKIEKLPAKIQSFCSGPGKPMAAKGILPGAHPYEILTVLYILSYDSQTEIAQNARQSIIKLPENILYNAIGSNDIKPEVIDFTADIALEKNNLSLLEKIILSQKVSDETIAKLGAKVDSNLIDIIVTNEERLLRYPKIIETVYLNKKTRPSVADRIIELAIRNSVEVEGIAVYKELKATILGTAHKEEEDIGKELEQAFETTLIMGEELEKLNIDLPVEDETQETEIDPQTEQHRKKMSTNINKLTIPQKIRLALLGNASHRAILVRDANKMVSMAAIKSPAVTDQEAAKYAYNKSLPDEIIKVIADRRDWTRNYQVKLYLVNNPKCPLSAGLHFLPHLRPFDLKAVAKSKNVAQAIAQAAQNLIKQKDKDNKK